MSDVVEQIKHDHREVEKLFARFEQTQDRAIAIRICDELTAHTHAEDEAVYPVLEDELSDGEKLMDEAEDEHKEARQLIGQVRNTSDPDHLSELMTKLKKAIEHHVEEEESEILPKARKEIDSQELDQLGEAFDAAKQDASS
jgi:hemerythrin superfamily protein